MSELSKQALKVDNNQSFPNNNNGAITPSALREFNVNMIDSLVDVIGYTADSASWNQKIDTLELSTASLNSSVSQLNASSASQQVSINNLNTTTASLNTSVSNLNTSASLALVTASFDNGTRNLTFTKGDNQTFSVNIPDVSGSTGNFATTGSNTFVGDQNISGSIVFPNGTQIRGLAGAQTLISSSTNLAIGSDTSIGINAINNLGLSGSNIFLQNLRYPNFDGTPGQVISTDGAGILTFTTVSGGAINTGSFAITGSNTFVADQTVSASIKVTSNVEMNKDLNAGIFFPMDSGRSVRIQKQVGINRLSWVAEDNAKLMYLDLDTDEFFVSGGFQAGLQNGYAWVGQSNGYSAQVATSSFASSIDTGSFATTGSNNFKGRESISDVEGTGTGEVYLLGRSGSLILGNSTTATYAGLSHYSSSTVQGGVNLILKSNNTATSLTISGSDNIISNPATATANFRRFIGSGGGNIMIGTNGTNIPQISGSMAFPITMNNNYIVGLLQSRGPVSSSTWTISNSILPGNIVIGSSAVLNAEKLVSGVSLTSNIVAGTLNIIANQSFISTSANITNNNINGTVTLNLSSSAISMNNNSINDSAFSFVNQFSSGAVGIGQPTMNVNTVGGASNTFILTGSQLGAGLAPGFNQNFVLGTSNTLFVNASTARVSGANIYQNAFATGLLGQRLIVSGSSNTNDVSSFGSVFVGRNNANDGIRNKTSDIIFAVGTGISSSADTRKTGFLIDSGSNTFVEGTLNVSGSTSTTGSITIQSGSGDLFVHGNKQFNVGVFYSTITQSGSAAVSQSMTFNTTDISQGVTIVNGTQFTLANSGVYNIQFSAQILADTGADDVWIWLKKNGTNIPDTAGRVTLANNDELMAAWNYVVSVNANDYIELVWQNSNGDAVLLYNAPTGNIPAVTSVIATVTQVR